MSGGDANVVEGPLKGYHHETYVIPMPGTEGDGEDDEEAEPVRVKCRAPRDRLLWFDRRCFASEEELVGLLQGRISRIPALIHVGDMPMQRFVEGHTLGSRHGAGRRVPEPALHQILHLFGELAAIAPGSLEADRRCLPRDRAEDGDCAGFLEGLVRFAEERVYQADLESFEALFAVLGIDEDSFRSLRKHVVVPGLAARPFHLLHADLHRENLILDHRGDLWTIDWELAMFGDPLYDLATHLHLMAYPADQRERVIRRWARVVREKAGPRATDGWQDDLPKLLDFKRAQSAFTDVIRATRILDTGGTFNWRRWPTEAAKVQRVLARAAAPLGLKDVPGLRTVAVSLREWHRRNGARTP
ncbi:aminoglycoside phosphotransferase [Streptomyces zinciresistens K42]|uniref:Aminoglycoside phosphotransferase n=1 Tax=Streptomyces zinciresistens K42 TaxID=700597 RepID=G2GAI3_9ACTN|nr:aminoglycoside phosphotransferase family protein [Streptomyces zinciresistens]EGX59430.1 aminoglycoside phosphotransferase [Streptomyces zinciresistens K42]